MIFIPINAAALTKIVKLRVDKLLKEQKTQSPFNNLTDVPPKSEIISTLDIFSGKKR